MKTEKLSSTTAIIEATEQEQTSNSQVCSNASPAPQTDDELIAELVNLSELEYEQRRNAAAVLLGVRVSILDKLIQSNRTAKAETTTASLIIFDDVEPWPERVRGDDVLTETYQVLKKYIIADEHTLRAATLWCALTWLIDHTNVMPLALISAPAKNCGKSVFLNVLSQLCLRPLRSSNISTSAMFRAIDQFHPTLFLDEVDTFFKNNSELVGIINGGHTRDDSYVLRATGENFALVPFSTWCAKAVAGINAKNLTDTLVSRSIILELRRKLPREKVASFRNRTAKLDFKTPQRKLMRFSHDIAQQFAATIPQPFGLDNRAADNWEGLIAIADIAGGEWPHAARRAALHIEKSAEDTLNISQELLSDIRIAFSLENVQSLTTEGLLEILNKNTASRWATFNDGQKFSSNQLARHLKDFGITPKQLWQPVSRSNLKGYKLEQFYDTFERYLPAQTATVASNTQVTTDFAARALEPNKSKDSKPIPSARTSHSLAPEKSLQTNQNQGSSVLEPKNGNNPDGNEFGLLEPLATQQRPHADCLAELDAAEEF